MFSLVNYQPTGKKKLKTVLSLYTCIAPDKKFITRSRSVRTLSKTCLCYWWAYLRKPGFKKVVLQGPILDREIEGFALDMSFILHVTDLYLNKFKWLGARRLNAIIISPTKTLGVL